MLILYTCLVSYSTYAVADDCETYYDNVYTKDVGSIVTERKCAAAKVQTIQQEMKQRGEGKSLDLETQKALTKFAVAEFETNAKLMARQAAGENVIGEICKQIASRNDRYLDLKFQIINKSKTQLDSFINDKFEELIGLRHVNDHDGHPVNCANVGSAEAYEFTVGSPSKTLVYKGPSAIFLNARSVGVRWISVLEGLRDIGAMEKFDINTKELKDSYGQMERALEQAKAKGLLKPTTTKPL